ncbi:TorD/DmsD family molecular chaperone [Thermodesulfatator atlanticus]
MALSELAQARIFMYDLIKSLFLEEPTNETKEKWLKALAVLEKGTEFEPLDKAIRELRNHLENAEVSDLQDEYYELFVNPAVEKPLVLTASYYLDGKAVGPTLARLRKILGEMGIKRAENFKENEDSLVFILDLMAILIENLEKKVYKDNRYQEKIFENFLKPCAAGVKKTLENHPKANFYKKCAEMLQGFLLLEERLFAEGIS